MPRQWGLRKFQTRVSFVARAAAVLAIAPPVMAASLPESQPRTQAHSRCQLLGQRRIRLLSGFMRAIWGAGIRNPSDFRGTAPEDQFFSLTLYADGDDLDLVVDPYHGPGTYQGGGSSGTATGSFSVQGSAKGPWGASGPGSSGTITVGPDERSGSLDWTMVATANASDGTQPVHVTAMFDCPLAGGASQEPITSPSPTQGETSCALSSGIGDGKLAAVGPLSRSQTTPSMSNPAGSSSFRSSRTTRRTFPWSPAKGPSCVSGHSHRLMPSLRECVAERDGRGR